jgi:hypothetical protein
VLRSVALWLRPAGWPLLPDAVRRRTLLLAWVAILAQAVFLGGWVLAGILEPHYSAVRQYISELGVRPEQVVHATDGCFAPDCLMSSSMVVGP